MPIIKFFSQEVIMAKQRDSIVDYLLEIPNFLSVFVFGLFFNMASLILLDISGSTGIEITDLTLIFTFFTVGVVIGQFTSTLYNKRFSNIQVIIACFIGLIPITLVPVFISNLYIFYSVYLIGGFLLGVIWIQASEFVLKNKIQNKDSLMTIHLTFYPIAALIAPIISSAIIRNGLSWRYTYYVIIFFIILTILLYLTLLSRRQGFSKRPEEKRASLGSIFVDRRKNFIFMIMIIAMFCYVLAETIIATWVPTFFREFRGLDVTSAGFILTLFWLFVIIGRVITIVFTGKIKATKIILVLSLIAIPSVLALVFLVPRYLIYIATAVAGLGFSAIFPLIVSTGSTIYEKGRGVLATGLFISANAGITAAPFIVKLTVRSSFIFSLAVSALFITLVFILVLIVQMIFTRRKA